MAPTDDEAREDDDTFSEGGFTVSREDTEEMLREFEERLPEMPEEAMPTSVDDLIKMVGSHDHSPRGYRHPGIIEVRALEPDDDEGQDDCSNG